MMRVILGFFLMLFLAAFCIFAIQNTATVTVRFLNWQTSAPFALTAVGLYLLGMLTGGTVSAFLRRSIRGVTAQEVRSLEI